MRLIIDTKSSIKIDVDNISVDDRVSLYAPQIDWTMV